MGVDAAGLVRPAVGNGAEADAAEGEAQVGDVDPAVVSSHMLQQPGRFVAVRGGLLAPVAAVEVGDRRGRSPRTPARAT
ncbi:hypothetical protein TNCT6_55870 [Streptomyces sp. 6-11-2]|nr:hypothetical protein TNCT6_55870 [Streptomyces sp. 6-11-2]